MANYLPEELLIEILSRVPVKSLVSFLSVSKSWYALITSPNFIAAHLSNVRQQKIPSNSSPLLIRRFVSSDRREYYSVHSDVEEEGGVADLGRNRNFPGKSTELDLPLKSKIGYLRVVGTCDGLVCLSDDLFTIRKPIYLWNPSVRKYVELPSPTFDPDSAHMFVLGFGADLRGVYKVVRVLYYKEDGQDDFTIPPVVEVCSFNVGLSVGFWRRITNVSVSVFITDFLWSQAFLNGAVHWISYARLRNKNGGDYTSSILRYDLENELFNEMTLPDELSCSPSGDLVTNVYMDDLAVIGYHRAERNGYCSIWVMKQYGVSESWTKLFTINLVRGMERVVGFQKNGSVLVAKGGDEMVMFNPKTNGIRELGVFGTPRSFSTHNFEETLILLGKQNVIVQEEQGTEDDHNFQEVGGNDCDGESSSRKNDGQERIIDGMAQLSCL